MKTAFLVLGPESTGTRLTTSLLIAGGCAGDDTHFQPFDSLRFGERDPIVWRRSFPWTIHRLWPDIGVDLLGPLQERGYGISKAVVTARDWYATAKSQVYRKHVRDEATALENIATAYRKIFAQLHAHGIPARLVSYDAVVAHQDLAVRPLLQDLGLDPDASLPPIRDESAKYYAPIP